MIYFRSLQGILTELHDYHSLQEQWLRLQERLMWEQAPLEAKLVAYNPDTFSAMLANRGQSCMQRTGDDGKPSVLSCDFNSDSQMMAHNLQIDITLSLQMLLRNVESQAQKISEQMSKGKRYVSKIISQKTKKEVPPKPKYVSSFNSLSVDSDELVVPATQEPIYPADMVISKTSVNFDNPGWPTKQQCVQWKLYANTEKDDVLPVFLLPENKGFE